MELQTIKMGSLYIDGKPMPTNGGECPVYYGKSYDITIGDTVKGQEITWVWIEEIGVWVADRTILCNISGIDLLEAGFIPGKAVEIDGKQFYCRLPRMVKEKVTGLNELYFIRKETQLWSPLWVTKDDCFWCDEIGAGSPFDRPAANLGQGIRNYATRYPENTRNTEIFFRPVLEPAQSGKKLSMEDAPFSFRLPNGGCDPIYGAKINAGWSEWGRAVQCNGDAPWTGYDTVCCDFARDQKTGALLEKAVLRGGTEALSWDKAPLATRERIGFRPMMIPLLEAAPGLDIFDPSVFSGVRDGTELKMYTLVLDGNPVKVTEQFTHGFNLSPKTRISFTDSYYGDDYLLSWIIFEGKAISKYILLNFISWADLEEQGFCEQKDRLFEEDADNRKNEKTSADDGQYSILT